LYCFSAETVLVLKNAFRSLSRLRDSRRKFESNHILSSVRIVTSLVGYGTYVTFKYGFSNQKTYQRTIWDYKRGDYTLMKQKIIDTNWEKLINDELDVNNACSNFTDAFLTIA
jgi:hypothetical protein